MKGNPVRNGTKPFDENSAIFSIVMIYALLFRKCTHEISNITDAPGTRKMDEKNHLWIPQKVRALMQHHWKAESRIHSNDVSERQMESRILSLQHLDISKKQLVILFMPPKLSSCKKKGLHLCFTFVLLLVCPLFCTLFCRGLPLFCFWTLTSTACKFQYIAICSQIHETNNCASEAERILWIGQKWDRSCDTVGKIEKTAKTSKWRMCQNDTRCNRVSMCEHYPAGATLAWYLDDELNLESVTPPIEREWRIVGFESFDFRGFDRSQLLQKPSSKPCAPIRRSPPGMEWIGLSGSSGIVQTELLRRPMFARIDFDLWAMRLKMDG